MCPPALQLSRIEYNIQEIALYISFSDCKQFIVKFPTSQITIKIGFIEISLVLVDSMKLSVLCYLLCSIELHFLTFCEGNK